MQNSFGQFLRTGGNGEFVLSRTTHGWSGSRVGLSIKGEFPNYQALRSSFEDRLNEAIETNTAMLLSVFARDAMTALGPADVPDVSVARAATLDEWDSRLSVIWSEWNSHPQRLRPLRQSMEEGLLRGFSGLINELRQRELGVERYTWRAQNDERVRDTHADRNGQDFGWDDPPVGGHPGQDYNCRCLAVPIVPGSGGRDTAGRDPINTIDRFLREQGPNISAGTGIRPRESLLDYVLPPEPGVTINGQMLDVQTQGDLAVAFLALDEVVRTSPHRVLDLVAEHGADFATLAEVFGRTAQDRFVAAAVLSAAGAPEAEIDRALTATRGPIDRFVGGVADALGDTAEMIRALPSLRWADIQFVARQIYEDPSVLPETMVAPFRERISVGDYAGALGYGLPEVLAGIAGLGGMRARAADLREPLSITRDMLDDAGKLEGIHNAGPNAPRFDRWIDGGGEVHMTPDGHFAYTVDLDFLGRRQTVTVIYRDGYPDFSPFLTHPSGVRSVEIEMTGRTVTDFRRANIAAAHPEWTQQMPDGWTWHHVEDGQTMQLVPARINATFGHEGGAAVARRTEQ